MHIYLHMEKFCKVIRQSLYITYLGLISHDKQSMIHESYRQADDKQDMIP